jgi:hypothetical protein
MTAVRKLRLSEFSVNVSSISSSLSLSLFLSLPFSIFLSPFLSFQVQNRSPQREGIRNHDFEEEKELQHLLRSEMDP